MRLGLVGAAVLAGLWLNLGRDFASAQQPDNLGSRPLAREIETALDGLARAEVSREEIMLRGVREKELSSLRVELRDVVSSILSCVDLQRELLRETYLLRPSQLEENAWSTAELESLGRNLQAQLARAYRNQALCYPDDSPDRTRALSLALQQVAEVVDQPLDEPGVWQARLEQIASLRLLGRFDSAADRIRHWQAAAPPANVASLFFGEQLRLALATRSWRGALTAIETHDPQSEEVAETDDAILEVLLVARAAANDEQLADLTQRAVAQLEHLGSAHGKHWQGRGEARLGAALAERPTTDDPRLLGFVGASLYSRGKLLEAANTYDRIAQLSAERGVEDQRHAALQTAASILRIAGKEEEALRRYRELAFAEAKPGPAAQIHLTAIGIAADQVRTASGQEQGAAFQRYRSLLEEHLARWPDSASSANVREWLEQTDVPAIDRARAETLVELGKRDKAILIYESLLQQFPNDGKVLEDFAKFLGEGTEPHGWRRALALWREVEQRSEPGGPRWKRGRQARMLLLERLGEGEKAKRLKQLTELIYPDTWGHE